MNKRALVLLSGGMDSTTLLHHVARDMNYAGVLTLAYDYGQRHRKELDSAAWQAKAAGSVLHRVVDMSFVGEMLKGATTLVAQGADVPDLDDLSQEQLDQPPTYVPNRNMMLLSIGASYAEGQGIQDVFYGAQAVDEYGYWDCTREFVERLNNVLALNRRDAVTIHAPFLDKKKDDILAIGKRLRVDYGHTWSCYRGGDKACGTCPTCRERLAAFAKAGIEDPLTYA